MKDRQGEVICVITDVDLQTHVSGAPILMVAMIGSSKMDVNNMTEDGAFINMYRPTRSDVAKASRDYAQLVAWQRSQVVLSMTPDGHKVALSSHDCTIMFRDDPQQST